MDSSIGFTSPHDAVLARMKGVDPPTQENDDGYIHEDSFALPEPSKEERYPAHPATSSTPYNPTPRKEVVHDPFDGTPIGVLATPSFDTLNQADTLSTDPPTSRSEDGESKEEQWEHLSHVLNLQTELARMHLEMEGTGFGDGKGKLAGKAWGRGKGKDINPRDKNWSDFANWKPKRQATTDTIGDDGHEGDDEGVDAAGSEELEMKKVREEQFASMAEQFEGRKESVQAIMSKLDQLSKALTEFHTLQAPSLDFSKKANSRQNSTTPDATPPQTEPKTTTYTSKSLPIAGLSAPPTRPTLSAVPSSRGSLTSTSEIARSTTVLPPSLSRTKEDTETVIEHITDSPESMKEHFPLATE
ncbi:hypothetical protein H0H92_002122 [Tricholoma furcatifolium]|nr:hypothetical protein H0H92_002122 [Tricholoma furcatifolium]